MSVHVLRAAFVACMIASACKLTADCAGAVSDCAGAVSGCAVAMRVCVISAALPWRPLPDIRTSGPDMRVDGADAACDDAAKAKIKTCKDSVDAVPTSTGDQLKKDTCTYVKAMMECYPGEFC